LLSTSHHISAKGAFSGAFSNNWTSIDYINILSDAQAAESICRRLHREGYAMIFRVAGLATAVEHGMITGKESVWQED
jgi:hypothetical protein